MSKYLITGGSGFIGTYFCEALSSYEVVNYDILQPIFETDAKYLEGDIHEVDKLAGALEGADTLIHLAATHFDFQKNYFKTNVEGTASLIKAAEKAGTKKILFLSSVAVYGSISKPTSELDQPQPDTPYGESKLEAEKLLTEWQKNGPDRLLVVSRPTVVYGPRNFGNVFNLIKQIDSGIYFHLGTGQNVKSITYVENLVNSCREVLSRHERGFYLFNNIDEPQLNTRDLGNLIAKLLGKKIRIGIPGWMAMSLAIPFDLITKISGINTPISRERILKFISSTHFLPDFLSREGIVPKVNIEDGLSKTISWYRSIDWKSEYKQWEERVRKYE